MIKQRTTSQPSVKPPKSPQPRTTKQPKSEAPARERPPSRVSSEEFRAQVAEAAYYLAEQRGFSPGYEERDWLQAETEVMQRLGLESVPHGL
jgi:hypothetical protein